MNAYREPCSEPKRPTLSFDYAAAMDAGRPRVARNTAWVLLFFIFSFGLFGLVPWFGWMGIPILLVAYLILAVFAAVRFSRRSSVTDVDEFEQEMMAKYRKKRRSRSRRRP